MSSLTDIVHDLEKAEVEGEPALGNTSMRTEPGTQQTPNAFYGVDVDFVDAISIGSLILGHQSHYEVAAAVLGRDVTSLAALTADEAALTRSFAYGQLGLETRTVAA